MASAPIVCNPPAAAPAKQHTSFLKQLGHLGLECVTKVLPVLTKGAQEVEPVIDLLFPLQGSVFSSVVNSVCMAEVAGAQAQTQPAEAGAVKLQAVWNAVGPQLLDLAQQQGLMGTDAEASAKQYIQAIFQLLDGPAKKVTTSGAAAATAS
jgi:hypothetical protein